MHYIEWTLYIICCIEEKILDDNIEVYIMSYYSISNYMMLSLYQIMLSKSGIIEHENTI